ncbi:MAG: DUF59 domain-containing protein [Acidobacteriaceae bacterium]|nr:DUF59 domain-containing protein [Acidobacteriaceae bacterium]
MTEADLLLALRDCFDPVSRQNIVDAHLVQGFSLTPDEDAPGVGIPGVPAKFIAHVRLLSPTSDEGLNAQLSAQIENRLAGLETISRTELKLLPPLFPMLR